MTLSSLSKTQSVSSKFKLIPAIVITLLFGFNHEAIAREIAVNSPNNMLTGQVSEMNRRSIASISGKQNQELIEAVQNLIEGYNDRNIPEVMANVDPNAPNYSRIEKSLENLFRNYDYNVAIDNIKLVEVSENKAEIELTYDIKMKRRNQLSRTYRDRESDIMIWQKSNGQWRYLSSR